ncbi:MAG: hypothetical protein COV44_03670 [Deltaproteobacteria bacterium CG11_big_fil_rev_8_21_14_0_20_45_16]|nr:MAG: hypothetical protein COV44_03670 [Deltaproteobacteria bacterium CG11_big_fil_rev_8_21_14_0_20_45_16]
MQVLRILSFLALIHFCFISPSLANQIFTDKEELGWGLPNQTKLFFHFPPDPVNVRTLNFFLPVVHFTLPCFFPIEIKAAYNSYSGDSSLFGYKWTFNHNIQVRPAVTHFEVVEGDGFVNKYTRERNLEDSTKALVSGIIIEIKKSDILEKKQKDEKEYKALEKRLLEDKIYREQTAKKLIKVARPLGVGTYYSLARGQSQLEKKTDGSFVRTYQNGSKEYFNADGNLTRSEDRNSNYLNYVYQSGNLIRITDMCKRRVEFAYQSDPALKGLVRNIQDGLGRNFEYVFDKQRRLLSYEEKTSKRKTAYRYDKNGNIVEIKDSGDPRNNISLTFNDKFEVSSQTGPGDDRTVFKRSFVGNNPNHSITEITKFKSKLPNGREVQEFKLGDFEVTTVSDKSGKEVSRKTKKFSTETGYPSSILDGAGRGDLFKYDRITGNLLERESVPAGEKVKFSYEEKCNQVKYVEVQQAQQPTKKTNYKFDAKCNVIEAKEMVGEKLTGHITVEYTDQGKTKFMRDLIGKQDLALTYWQYGKPESITLKDSGTLLVSYRPTGEIDGVKTFPNGKGKERLKEYDDSTMQRAILKEVRSALDQVLSYLRPAGLNIGL